MSDQVRAARPPIPGKIWVLVGAAFVIAIGFGLVSPVLPAYARSFDVGVTGASIIVSAFAFFRLAFAPVGGRLVSMLGERPVYLVGLLIVAASSFATAFAGSYPQLLVYRGLGGIGSTMFTISAMALLVRLAPASARGRVSSAYGSSFLIGGMIGPVLGGLLAGFGMRVPFIAYGLALIVAALVVAIGLGGGRLGPRAHTGGDASAMTLREAWAIGGYRAILVSNVAHGWTNFGVRMAIVPLLATTVLDRPWVAGAVLAVGAVGTAGTLQVSGRLADRIGRRPLVLGGLLVMAVAMGLLGFSGHDALGQGPGLAALFTLSLLSGIGAGFVSPGLQASVADVIGRERSGGTVLSAFQMTQDAGAILGPILIGVVADRAGFEAAFLATGVVCLLGAVPWLWARDTLELAHEPVPEPDPA